MRSHLPPEGAGERCHSYGPVSETWHACSRVCTQFLLFHSKFCSFVFFGNVLQLPAAVDTRVSRRSIAAVDTQSRQQEDYSELVKAALLKPFAHKQNDKLSEADAVQLHQLTKSKRKLVVDEALEVR